MSIVWYVATMKVVSRMLLFFLRWLHVTRVVMVGAMDTEVVAILVARVIILAAIFVYCFRVVSLEAAS